MMKKKPLTRLFCVTATGCCARLAGPTLLIWRPSPPKPCRLACRLRLSQWRQILTLEQLCQPLTYGRAALLLASARRLAGTPARLHLFPVQAYHPERLADCQVIRLPYAQEWLTAAECDDLLAFLKASLTQISEIVTGIRSASPPRLRRPSIPSDGQADR
jgi:hypothetical protein